MVHKRIANYCKLYSGLVNFSEFMVVSHRNMVSIYDMSKSEERDSQGKLVSGWIETFKHDNGYIRQMVIKKRSR